MKVNSLKSLPILHDSNVILLETTKAVTGWLSGFIGRISGSLVTGTSTDVETVSASSEQELLELCEQAKTKIITTEGVSAAESERYLAIIESIRVTAVTRVTQVKQVATEGGASAVEQLKVIEQESQHDITKHYHEATAVQVTEQHVTAAVEETKVSEAVGEKKDDTATKSHDHHHTGLKVAAGAAAVAAGAAAISIIAGHDSEKTDDSKATVTHVETGVAKIHEDKEKQQQQHTQVTAGKSTEQKQAAAVIDTGKSSSVVVTEEGKVTAVVDTGKSEVSAETAEKKETDSSKTTVKHEQQAAIAVEVGQVATEVISEKEQAAISVGKTTTSKPAHDITKQPEHHKEQAEAAVAVVAGKVVESDKGKTVDTASVVEKKEQGAVVVEVTEREQAAETTKKETEHDAAVAIVTGKVTEVVSEKEEKQTAVSTDKEHAVQSTTKETEHKQQQGAAESGKVVSKEREEKKTAAGVVAVETGKIVEREKHTATSTEKEHAAQDIAKETEHKQQQAESGKILSKKQVEKKAAAGIVAVETSKVVEKEQEEKKTTAGVVETGKTHQEVSEHENTHATIDKHKTSEKHDIKKGHEHEKKESSHTALEVAAGAAIIAGGAAAAAAIIHHHHEKENEEKAAEKQEKQHQDTQVGKTETGIVAQHKEESAKVEEDKTTVDKKTTETVTESGKASTVVKEEQVVSATVIASQSIVAQKVSTNVQDLRVTIREWYAALVERVSAQSGKAGVSKAEIEAIIQGETEAIHKHIEVSSGKIRESFTSETETKELEATLTWIKSTVSKSTTQVQEIAVQVVSGSTNSNGAAQLQAIAASHQQEIEEAFVQCEHKIKKVTAEKKTSAHIEEKHKESGAAVHEKVKYYEHFVFIPIDAKTLP